jgi:hypothetical protein
MHIISKPETPCIDTQLIEQSAHCSLNSRLQLAWLILRKGYTRPHTDAMS